MRIIGKGGAFTNHPGVIDYKGKSYFFYHNGALPGGGGFTRSVCLDEFQYNKDGSIRRITPTIEGVKPVRNLNPFIRQEAETIAWEQGIETERNAEAGVYVTEISNGDYIKVRSVDFKKGAKSFQANIAAGSGGIIEIHLNSIDGEVLGACEVKTTGGFQNWKSVSTKVRKTKGIHDLYFVFKGSQGDLFNFNWWKFDK
jgi:hypothetical protein